MIDDVNVQNSLAELLDDNYYAIQRFISRNSIKRIVEIMKAQLPHEKYLKILSSICVCKGKSITNNQIYCLNLFYQQISFEFRFQFKKENNKILVLSHISKANLKWRTFQQFYQDSLEQDEQQSWNYFISYFILLSDICCNRNKITKKFVDENFPLDVLCAIIEDPDSLKINAIEPFLKRTTPALTLSSHPPRVHRLPPLPLHQAHRQGPRVETHRAQPGHPPHPLRRPLQARELRRQASHANPRALPPRIPPAQRQGSHLLPESLHHPQSP